MMHEEQHWTLNRIEVPHGLYHMLFMSYSCHTQIPRVVVSIYLVPYSCCLVEGFAMERIDGHNPLAQKWRKACPMTGIKRCSLSA